MKKWQWIRQDLFCLVVSFEEVGVWEEVHESLVCTEVAVVVLPPLVRLQLLRIEEPLLTELTQRVSLLAQSLLIPCLIMNGQLRSKQVSLYVLKSHYPMLNLIASNQSDSNTRKNWQSISNDLKTLCESIYLSI